ncbi:hypothetical protein EJB05_31569 [Eragrostis curvula]|uniref:Ternary complex factor MIP1 leucine-zipper domain-containing protein n=1 Tax=Eragrostis curvula TaxID=38414 RepID=A0A5J9UFJ2_9POAL|nr:hypothetical protein EJB05_31569 [Eragrostis curvula]
MSSPTPLRPTTAAAAGSSSGSYQQRRRGRGASLKRPRVRRCKMKLMYFLMDRDEQRGKRLELEFEVADLETTLDKEQRLGRVLQCSLQGRVVCHCCLSALVLPTKVRSLLGELAMVEDEIFYLEKKVDDLRLRLHRERKWNDHCVVQQTPPRSWPHHQDRQPPRHSSCGLGCRKELKGAEQQLPRLPCPATDEALECESKASVGSASVKGEEVEHARRSSHCHSPETPTVPDRKLCLNSPNKLSEDLIKLTVTIFHKLNRTSPDAATTEPELGGGEPKLNISCIGASRSLVPKVAATGAAAAMSPLKSRSNRTPKGRRGGEGGGCRRRVWWAQEVRRVHESVRGCQPRLVVPRGHQEPERVDAEAERGGSELPDEQAEAGVLDQHLQLLRDACTAFLQHGLPPSPDKLLALLNQASVNVGGTVLNVLSIEHLILRHSPEGKQVRRINRALCSHQIFYPS